MFKSTFLCLALATCATLVACDDDNDDASVNDGGVLTDGGGTTIDGGPKFVDSGVGADASKPDAAAVVTPDAAKPADAPVVSPPPNACSTPCLAKLLDTFKACAPAGACVESNSGASFNTCYANGVKMSLSSTFETRAYKAGGGLCYSASVDLTTGAGEIKDGAGASLGTFAINDKDETIFTCGGQQYNVTTLDCPGLADNDQTCSEGACTVP